MKFIQRRLYDIWYYTTYNLLQIKGLEKENFKEPGRRAWGLLMECTTTLTDDAEMTVAFWTAWQRCNVTYKELAEVLTEHRKSSIQHGEGKKNIKETVTEDNVKTLLFRARAKIRKRLDLELKDLKIHHGTK